jgi:hypothetical protein
VCWSIGGGGGCARRPGWGRRRWEVCELDGNGADGADGSAASWSWTVDKVEARSVVGPSRRDSFCPSCDDNAFSLLPTCDLAVTVIVLMENCTMPPKLETADCRLQSIHYAAMLPCHATLPLLPPCYAIPDTPNPPLSPCPLVHPRRRSGSYLCLRFGGRVT